MASSKQTMRGVKSGGKVRQISNIPTQQAMANIEAAADVEQLVTVVGSEISEITKELNALLSDATKELQKLKEAEEAAKRGDSSGVVASLKNVSKWVLHVAEDVGSSLVAKVIEKQMGL